MNTVIQEKTSTSIRIDTGLLSQIREEAKAENRSVSNYIETLLYRVGYRPFNEETYQACKDSEEGKLAGQVDTTSLESIEASLFDDDDEA